MAEFSFKAATPAGQIETGSIAAASMADAMAQLEERHLNVFDLQEQHLSRTRTGLGRRRVGHADLVVLVRELSTLANAGISLADALATLRDANRETALAAPLGRMVSAIHAGEGFSAALAQAGLSLPEYVHAMVRAGEATGNLGLALNRAADQMQFDARMRAQTREALIYPTILVVTGTLAVLFIFSFVVPRFAGLLKGRIDALPWISAIVLKIGLFFNAYFLQTLAALAVIAVVVILAARHDALRTALLNRTVHVPVVGAWLRSGETARWTNGLSMLLQSRVGILPALDLAAGSVRLRTTHARLLKVRAEVNRGRRLSQAIEHQQLLEATSLSMVRVGEQSGELGPMLQHVADYWSEKNQSMQRRVVSLIEPAAILALGAVIGFVMVGVVLAMASLSEVKF
ncbi:MAG: type II secretion system F family protein [Rhodocyclaceae bacterium]